MKPSTTNISGWETTGDLWTCQVSSKDFFPLRVVAFRARDGFLIVYNPVKGLDETTHQDLLTIGEPRYIITPNHYHTLAANQWQARYPKAQFYAHEQAHPRLGQKTNVPWKNLLELRPLLPDHIQFLMPRGLKTGEVGLCFQQLGENTWVVGDLFFNITTPPAGVLGWILRVAGTAPGLRSSRVFRMIAVQDRRAYLDWLTKTLKAAPPLWLIPTHGDTLTLPDLGPKMLEAAHKTLGRATP